LRIAAAALSRLDGVTPAVFSALAASPPSWPRPPAGVRCDEGVAGLLGGFSAEANTRAVFRPHVEWPIRPRPWQLASRVSVSLAAWSAGRRRLDQLPRQAVLLFQQHLQQMLGATADAARQSQLCADWIACLPDPNRGRYSCARVPQRQRSAATYQASPRTLRGVI